MTSPVAPTPPDNPYPRPSSGLNGWAVAGFICAFLCALPGLVFSIIGLSQINHGAGRGRGLALAGIIISSVVIVASIVVEILLRV